MAKKNTEKGAKKNNHIVLIILGVIIVVLLIGLFILNNFYFNVQEHAIDYLKFETRDYLVSEDDSNELKRKDGKCSIILSSRIEEEVNLDSMGDITKINGFDWAKQEFDNGVNWMSYYKNIFYVIQMFGKDKETYNKVCKKDFDDIKDKFIFMKNE